MEDQSIPYLTTEQMVEVDRLMIEEYGIKLIQMMENAGRQLAVLAARRFLDNDPGGKSVVLLAGRGGNGGGALVCARNLLNWGAGVRVALSAPPGEYSGVIRHQLGILESYPAELGTFGELDLSKPVDLIIDGIIGYSLRGAPRGSAAEMIRWANTQGAPVLALDVPSGLDSSTGKAFQPVIQATATLTLALPKIGLKKAQEELVGELYLADIGVPPGLYARPPLNLRVGPLFQKEQIIRLR